MVEHGADQGRGKAEALGDLGRGPAVRGCFGEHPRPGARGAAHNRDPIWKTSTASSQAVTS